ncbi:MAG TPA: hypothetical protein VMS18_29160 [Candidatus Binatia bacterium]|nr:hypothetical protein [Candidatus Binatia bacterium]
MPKLTIRPSSVLLTSGQAATFEAVDEKDNAVAVSWDLSPAIGSLSFPKAPPLPNVPGAGATQAAPAIGSPSATYIAPLGASSQMVSIIANSTEASGSATICLTADAMSIIPVKVELKPNQQQQFVAIVAGVHAPPQPPVDNEPATSPPAPLVKWVLSPPFGTLDDHGLYTAPAEVPDTATVSITAASETTGKQATATVNLTSPPWTGRGVQFLAAYLLLVFTLVFFIIGLWPPALPSAEMAKADRIEAEDRLRQKNDDLDKTEAMWAQQERKSQDPAPANSGATTTSPIITAETRNRVRQSVLFAQQDLERKRTIEDTVNRPYVETRMGIVNRELDLLWLVMLAGCLGTFLHTSQSFSDYVGNRTIKSNWAWWYYLRPFIGAGLAVVFYTALRGGVIAIATGTNAKTSDLNPFGVVATAALVGMFSKSATMKLGEVFETLFKSDKAQATKDKLANLPPTTQTSGTSQAAATTTPTGATK